MGLENPCVYVPRWYAISWWNPQVRAVPYQKYLGSTSTIAKSRFAREPGMHRSACCSRGMRRVRNPRTALCICTTARVSRIRRFRKRIFDHHAGGSRGAYALRFMFVFPGFFVGSGTPCVSVTEKGSITVSDSDYHGFCLPFSTISRIHSTTEKANAVRKAKIKYSTIFGGSAFIYTLRVCPLSHTQPLSETDIDPASDTLP